MPLDDATHHAHQSLAPPADEFEEELRIPHFLASINVSIALTFIQIFMTAKLAHRIFERLTHTQFGDVSIIESHADTSIIFNVNIEVGYCRWRRSDRRFIQSTAGFRI